MRVRLIVEYDGTNYVGWQRQRDFMSVQEAMELAFECAVGEKVCLHSAGRTDAGVHAEAQVVHFDTDCVIPPERLSYVFNMYLPPDIRVRRSEAADPNFHARFDAKAKTYRYTIYSDRHAPAIYRHTAAFVRGRLDLDKMRDAAARLCGTHDFKPFSVSGTEVKDTVRTIFDITVTADLPNIWIDVTGGIPAPYGAHHCRHADTGGHRQARTDCIDAILAGRELAGPTAPAHGLTMKRCITGTIRYREEMKANKSGSNSLFVKIICAAGSGGAGADRVVGDRDGGFHCCHHRHDRPSYWVCC